MVMGYLSDWLDAERLAREAREMHPDCDLTLECPAAIHLLDCRRYRREQRDQARPKPSN